jgi:phenylpyruvate tautomerase PptA (4-oxalocrotonate tautomerase family)
MPFVRIEIRAGKGQELKKALLDEVHAALVEAFHIPDHDRTQRLIELEPEWLESPPERRPDPILIEVACFSGRSVEAKQALYRELAERLERLGVDRRNVAVVLHEVPRPNWGFGGLAGDQVELGFTVEV